MKIKQILIIALIAISTSSCSKSGSVSNIPSNTACNEIVCGGYEQLGTYTIYRGTKNPDTCGSIELTVNAITFYYYKSNWDANPEGYCCWEGLK